MRMTTIAPSLTMAALLTLSGTLFAQASANPVPVMLPPDGFDSLLMSVERDAPEPPVEATAELDAVVDDAGAASIDPPVSETESLPLPPIERRTLGATPENVTTASDVTDVEGWLRTGLALAGVIGLLIVFRFVLVRAGRRRGLGGALGAGGRAPSGVLSVLGRYPIARGRSLVLLQLDTRVLLLDQSSDGFKTLSEITDEREVASILMKTRDEEGASQVARFNGMLREMESDPRTLDDQYTTDELSERVRRMRGLGV